MSGVDIQFSAGSVHGLRIGFHFTACCSPLSKQNKTGMIKRLTLVNYRNNMYGLMCALRSNVCVHGFQS